MKTLFTALVVFVIVGFTTNIILQSVSGNISGAFGWGLALLYYILYVIDQEKNNE